MVTVETPASFQWNDTNSLWVKNYLRPKSDLLTTLTDGIDLDLNDMSEDKFKQLCQLLETSAEGRELRNKMFKAWRSKKSRDSDNGKKLFTFNLSIKAGEQLKKVAKQVPLNQTLEALIFAGKTNNGNDEQLHQQLKQYKIENKRLQQQLNDLLQKTQAVDDDAEIQSLINSDLQVTELAKLEKSKLIKQILMLKRKS
ncbi:hypothetical protein V6255_01435 [Psychromonas arctica]|uniref:Uncharacterized protein n=1 Tax=Psychromonas arctica TaxID=168275 RepID=A0ABU9H7D5_9GAMM